LTVAEEILSQNHISIENIR